MFRLSAILLIFTTFFGCQKPDYQVRSTLYQLPESGHVRSLFFHNDTLFTLGGDRESGFVYALPHGSEDSPSLVFSASRAFYSMVRHNGEWFIGSDSVFIYRGTSWSTMDRHRWLEADWVSNLSKHPIRAMAQNDEGVLAVAGGKLSFGVVFHSYDQGMSWSPEQPENEIRTAFIVNGVAWVGGNGLLMRSKWGSGTWERLPLEGAFITGICFTSNKHGWALTQAGEVLESNDGGDSWDRVFKRNLPFMHDIRQVNDLIVAVGNSGSVIVSKDAGESWSLVDLGTEADLYHVEIHDQTCYLAAENGQVLSFFIADLK